MGKRRWAMMSDDGWVIGKTIGGIVDKQKQARPGRFREAGRHHRMGGNSKKSLGSTTSCASLLSALLCMGQGGVRSMGWAGGPVLFCFFFFWAVWDAFVGPSLACLLVSGGARCNAAKVPVDGSAVGT